MKSLRKSIPVLALSLPLLGCPYDAKAPLSPAAAGLIDAKLVGNWRCVSGNDEKTLTLSVFAFDEQQYYVHQAQEAEQTHFRAFSTPLRGVPLLSVQELGEKPEAKARKWYFVRYAMPTPKSLQVRFLREEPFKGVAESAFRGELEKVVERDEVYDDYCVCAKVVEKTK